jgi:lipopolysaccharide export system permease protein
VKIINKYVLREHLGPLLFALSALTSLLLLNYVAKRFSALVGKGLEWQVIAEFLLLSLPFTVAMTIPMAVLVSTLYAFSRMAAENEITAFKASGVSMRRLLTPVLWAAVLLAIGMIYFNDQLLARANNRLAILQSDILRKKPTFALRPQVTNRVTDRLWLRAGLIEGEKMHDVIIYDFTAPENPRTIYADSGTLALTPSQADLALTLYDGVVREFPRGAPGRPTAGTDEAVSPTLQQTFFTDQRVLVRGVGNQMQRTDAAGAQVKSDREMTVCELQANYERHAREYAEAHDELARLAAQQPTGAPTEVPPRRTTYARNGLGALYCRLLDQLGVQTANAAEPQAVTQDSMPGDPPGPSIVPPAAPVPAGVAGPGGGDTGTRGAGERMRRLAEAAGGVGGVVLTSAQMQVASSWSALNKYDVEIQKKFALAVACVVFILLGAPIALRFPRGGVGLVIGVSLGVFGLYYVGLIAGETLANKGYLPPWAAMWAANIIFTMVGVVLLARMGREGATARGGDLGELWDSLRGLVPGRGRRAGRTADARGNG